MPRGPISAGIEETRPHVTVRSPRKARWCELEMPRGMRIGLVSQARRLHRSVLALLALLLLVASVTDRARAATISEGNLISIPQFERGLLGWGSWYVRLTQVGASDASNGSYLASTNSACWQQFGSFSVGHWPPACWRPYGSRSPFNTPIPSNPRLSPESTAIINYMLVHHWSFEGDHFGNLTADSGGSRPVYWSQSTDPLVKVICGGRDSCRRGMRLHIPRGAQPEHQSDGHITVVDQTSGSEYDFWQASTPEHGVMTVSAGNRIPIGAGTGTGLGGGAEAADLGLLGGLIRAP